jgi:hypothetical protein
MEAAISTAKRPYIFLCQGAPTYRRNRQARLRWARGWRIIAYQEQTMSMSFDISHVDWVFVGLMAGGAFIAALLGSLIAFRNRFLGAIIAGILFGAFFVGWNYTVHNFGLPVVKSIGLDGVTGTVTPPTGG